MAWGWIAKRLAGGSPRAGVAYYLAIRNHNKSLEGREKSRREAIRDLIERLPPGAVYAERTADGWTEIRMPNVSSQPLVVLAADNFKPGDDPDKWPELRQTLKDLESGKRSDRSESLGAPGTSHDPPSE